MILKSLHYCPLLKRNFLSNKVFGKQCLMELKYIEKKAFCTVNFTTKEQVDKGIREVLKQLGIEQNHQTLKLHPEKEAVHLEEVFDTEGVEEVCDKEVTAEIPGRTDIINELNKYECSHTISKYTCQIQIKCVSCDTLASLYISTINGKSSCVDCGVEMSYSDLKRNLSLIPVSQERTEEYLSYSANKMTHYADLDSDLYDRVSYLDLMSMYEERERQKKVEQLEKKKKLRNEQVF